MKHIYTEESMGGSCGHFKLDIQAECKLTQQQIHDSKTVREAIWKAAEILKDALLTEVLAQDPQAQENAVNERKEILSLFPSAIFVQAIPNEYSNQYYTKHLPWFYVTTPIGRFKVGWRKRVLHIEWTETMVAETAAQLFPNEDVTKEGRMIHAWSYEKAKEYIAKILATTPQKWG